MASPDEKPVSFLKEVCDLNKIESPKYTYLESEGPDHRKEFKVICSHDGFEVVGKGFYKKQAKKTQLQI